MRGLVIGVGILAQMVAWWRISTHGTKVWAILPWVLGAMGIAALLLMPSPQRTTAVGTALAVGAASGLLLFAATRIFVSIAGHWGPFARHVEEAYAEAADEPVRTALILSLLVSVPAEEVFYRGLVQRTLATSSLAEGGAAAATLLLYVIGNLPSRSLPIVAGAIVGGAVWGALAWWSGGLAAPLASHVLWTGLMLVFPPVLGRSEAAA
ncbi:MAG TPA: CPBP family intramembrane glutamic endopeptidase [Actinomycetota bacterium]|nr:CPBP family intramembrane glutamic endopeptidase [Actinomycetota bacterium]